MEHSNEDVKLIKWVPFVVFSYAFLRCVLEAYEISCDNGFVLIADNEISAREFREGYCRATGEYGLRLNIKEYQNYSYNNCCAGLINLTRQKLDECEAFLDDTRFFPVLVCGGILPKELRENHYLFRISEKDVEYVSSTQFNQDIHEWCDYAIANIMMLCKCFELIDTSEAIRRNKNQVDNKTLFKMLTAIGEAYSYFLREKYDEKIQQLFRQRYIKMCVSRINRISQFADGLDICEILAEAIWNYVKRDQVEKVLSVESCDQSGLKLLAENKAILYDEEYYYITEAMMRKICIGLLVGFSWTELKGQLADASLIEKEASGYTIKKTITCNGQPKRIRTMWLHKEFLLTTDNVETLEEYVGKQEEK